MVFSGILVSSANKTNRHDITEILLKVVLNTPPPLTPSNLQQTPFLLYDKSTLVLRLVLLAEETRIPEKTIDLPQTLSHNVVSSTPRLSGVRTQR
jgi:hypothetical protein